MSHWPNAGIGWRYHEHDDRTLTEFEGLRHGVRHDRQVYMQKGYLPAAERNAYFKAVGVDDEEIEAELSITREVHL